jgi:hypothetical protein
VTDRETQFETHTAYTFACHEESSVNDQYDSDGIETDLRDTSFDFDWETRTLRDCPHYPCIAYDKLTSDLNKRRDVSFVARID